VANYSFLATKNEFVFTSIPHIHHYHSNHHPKKARLEQFFVYSSLYLAKFSTFEMLVF